MATFADLITQAEGALAAKRTLSAALNGERTALLAPLAATDSLTVDGQTRFDALTADKRAADVEITTLDAKLVNLRAEAADDEKATREAAVSIPAAVRQAPAVVGNEPRVYERATSQEVSFFQDMYKAKETNERGAIERQARYVSELAFDKRSADQKRATSTSSFAGLIPPQYLVDEAALVARAGRPTANIVRGLPLPDEGMSLIIPKGTTGVSVAVQISENSNVSSTDQVWANVTVPVVTIAGQQDVSRQSLERGMPGIDSLVYADLAAAYAVQLDSQVLFGTGAGGQMLGILNTAGVVQSTAFAAAVTPTTFLSKLAGAINQVETTRFAAPDAIIMHPRRWNWLTAQVDTAGRPLVVPNANGPFNAFASFDSPVDVPSAVPVGTILGISVLTDASIPSAVGTGPEDQVIVARRADLLLWEIGDGSPVDLRFEQTLGNQLTVKLVAYGYAAFTAGRFPTAASFIGGNAALGAGLIAPTF